MSLNIISNVLSEDDINYILNLPEVIEAKESIDSKINGSVYFSISLTTSIKNTILEKFGLEIDSVPMRWIKGDTHPHIDTGSKQFQKTHLVYLTDNPGKFLLEYNEYDIKKGSGFVFNEGISHETINTGLEPRLLLGPMSEEGLAVGYGIGVEGGTIVYIKQDGINLVYSIDQSNWIPISFGPGVGFPITNINTSKGFVKVYFRENITINSNSGYFTCGSNYIQFGSETLKNDGTRPIININVSDYDGLIFNGSSGTSGYDNIYIYNLIINGVGGSQQIGTGWFGLKYFGLGTSNNYIINCSSIGDINGGGILGDNAENVTLIGCSSSGIINNGAGGIVGQYANLINIESCWSEGLISGDGAGGIVGALSESVEVTNCYSTGDITGSNSGGIVGSNAGSVLINNCYSQGAISGGNAGGICGSLAPSSGTYSVTISNCYTIGYLTNNFSTLNGGICGPLIPYGGGTVALTINNCYTSGGTNYTTGYIIGNITIINGSGTGYTLAGNYSEANNGSSGWDVINAQSTLTGVPSYPPVTWISIGASIPFELFNMGYTPYSTTNIVSNSLVRNSSLSVTPGGTTISGPLKVSSYFILNSELVTANIDPNNGAISVPSSTTPGTYTLWIYNLGSYNVTTVTLTVTDSPKPAPTPGAPYLPIKQSVSLNQKSSFCGTRAVSATAVGIGAIRGKGSATRIFNNCKNNNSSNFQICQFRVLGYK